MSATESRPIPRGDAVITADGRYRYLLSREWDVFENRRVLFVMLNPSTADATQDDPTIRKCVGFAKRWGFGALDVVNLYALRSTKPDGLWAPGVEPIGEVNDAWIDRAALGASRIIAAWGSEMRAQGRARDVLARLATRHHVEALRVTLGPPWHPLYVPYAAEPVVVRRKAADGGARW